MPSASLIPAGDPTLLFTSAGMVPFKPFFTGEQIPPSRRLTSCQKSFRTTDIDQVGDHKHLTFFEMLGNFSIGDYLKQDAIRWAWEFLTSTSEGLGLEGDRLYATVLVDDEEAFRHWTEDVGLPSGRIYRYGEQDNWWGPAGREGPCGPCSELHYDYGVEYGCGRPLRAESGNEDDCHPNHDCERFVELWNLVFLQYHQDPQGKRTALPAPSVDTGLGLERAAAIMQGVSNLYETDLLRPLVEKAAQLSGKAYSKDRDTDYALRVVAEHGRAAAFLIADGVVPSNEGRGYVLRRIIRRTIRYGRRLGLEGKFLESVVDVAIERFGQAYLELAANRDFILRGVGLEEERFAQTLRNGEDYLRGFLNEVPRIRSDLDTIPSNPGSYAVVNKAPFILSPLPFLGRWGEHSEFEALGALDARRLLVDRFSLEEYEEFPDLESLLKFQKVQEKRDLIEKRLGAVECALPGSVAFTLYETYGFPLELTIEILKEQGLQINLDEFNRQVESHRERSRAAHVVTGGMEMQTRYENLDVGEVEFVGYQRIKQDSVVTVLLVDGSPVGSVARGQQVEVVLKETPFYPQDGGQVGDAGTITGPNGSITVQDTQSPMASLIVHRGVVAEGEVSLGDPVEAKVDPTRRVDTARNHSGTHLLHGSLRLVLGPHVRQAGSLVAPDRLRFDYTHIRPLSREEMLKIQGLANQKMREDLKVTTHVTTYAQAIQEGALAFFGDKYGERVRVVAMSERDAEHPFSLEVCGGTHVGATGEVGPLFILGDSSIGGGMRRVEAVTGRTAEELFVERSDLLQRLSRRLETPLGDLEGRLENFLAEMGQLRKQMAELERQNLRGEAEELLLRVQQVDGVQVLAARTSATSVEALREMGDWLKAKLSSVVLVLALVQNGNPLLVSMVTPDLVSKGLHAGNTVREVAQVLGGGGGGGPEMAQAGGKRLDKLPEALARVVDIVRREVKP